MVESPLERSVGGRLVGVDGSAEYHVVFDETDQGGRVGVLDDGGLDLAAALAHPGDRHLPDCAPARSRERFALAVRHVPPLAPDAGLVDFDHVLQHEVAATTSLADTMQHMPRRPVLATEFF